MSTFTPDRDQIEVEAGVATADAVDLLWRSLNATQATLGAQAANGLIARYYDDVISDLGGESALGARDLVGLPSGASLTGHALALESGAGDRWAIAVGADAYDSFLAIGMADVGSFNFERALSIYYNSSGNNFEVVPRGGGVGAATTKLGNATSSAHRFTEAHVTDYYEKGRTQPLGHWTTYTPVLHGSSSDPTNYAIAGRYTLVGKTCHFSVGITFTSSSTFGSGFYSITLPVSANSGTAGLVINCSALYRDDTTGGRRGGTADFLDADSIFLIDSQLGLVGPTNPYTWADNDNIIVAGTYEID